MTTPLSTSIFDLMSLKGRTALITGAAGHLGSIFAKTLAELGSDLILVDMNKNALGLVNTEIKSRFPVNVHIYETNLEYEDSRDSLIDKITINYPKLDILVNNAAYVGSSELSGWIDQFENQSLSTWRSAIEVNLTSAFHLTQKLVPLLKKSDHASVVNIGSIYGVYAPDMSLYQGTNMGNPAAYSISKAGLVQLTKWLSTILAPDIRVNAISPGGIYRSQDESFVSRYVQRTPLARMGSEEDFRGAIVYLASDLSRWVTGQNLMVDGGWGVW